MIAYIFWHQAPAGPAADYEAALGHYADALARTRCPGFIGSASYRIAGTPWMPEPGYEDWTWLEGSWALDELNRHAVEGEAKAPHDTLAQATRHGGFGALHYLVAGEHRAIPGDSKVFWLSRPRGIAWRDVIPRVVAAASSPVSVWRRQMVLGPSSEFAVVGEAGLSLAVPEGWRAVGVDRHRL